MPDKKEVFITAIKRHEGLIFKVASVYTNTADDRNDLVQEIIYQLWRSFDSFNQSSALSTWMYRVAMNVAIYQLKISKRQIRTVPVEGHVMDLYDAINDELSDKLQELGKQLNKLDLLEKGIVMLYLEDKTYAEIAQITGISETNVGTKMSRIREKLRKQIAKQL